MNGFHDEYNASDANSSLYRKIKNATIKAMEFKALLAQLYCQIIDDDDNNDVCTAARTQRPRVRIPLKSRNTFFSGYFAIA